MSAEKVLNWSSSGSEYSAGPFRRGLLLHSYFTEKQGSSKQNAKEDRLFRFQSIQERLNSININVAHRIRYHEQTDLNDTDHLVRSSHFHQSLEHWSALNFSEAYGKLFKRLHSLASSLEQVVYNRDRIFEIVLEAFHERNPLILETLLDLVVQLARDLQVDSYLY